MVNTTFALKFTLPCKLARKCRIYHRCFSFSPSLHFFALYLHLVNFYKSNFIVQCMVLYSKDFSQQATHSPWVLRRQKTPNNNKSLRG